MRKRVIWVAAAVVLVAIPAAAGLVSLREDDGGRRSAALGSGKAKSSKVKPIAARKLHGTGFLGNSRLGKIENGSVPCLHSETLEVARCAFSKRGEGSGSWLESPAGEFARVGQAISLDGEPGGEYVVAARVGPDSTVPALEPSGRDSAGTPTGMELAEACVVEVSLGAENATGEPLVNHATLQVPTSDNPHPDNAALVKSTSDGIHYYTGQGAALNDINGAERDKYGLYYGPNNQSSGGGYRCHTIWSGGYEVYAAKRPATAYGKVVPKSPIRWRSVSPNVTIANDR